MLPDFSADGEIEQKLRLSPLTRSPSAESWCSCSLPLMFRFIDFLSRLTFSTSGSESKPDKRFPAFPSVYASDSTAGTGAASSEFTVQEHSGRWDLMMWRCRFTATSLFLRVHGYVKRSHGIAAINHLSFTFPLS